MIAVGLEALIGRRVEITQDVTETKRVGTTTYPSTRKETWTGRIIAICWNGDSSYLLELDGSGWLTEISLGGKSNTSIKFIDNSDLEKLGREGGKDE